MGRRRFENTEDVVAEVARRVRERVATILPPAVQVSNAAAAAEAIDTGEFNYEWLMSIVGETPASATALKQFEDKFASLGIEVIGNADGTKFDTLKLPSGVMVDVVKASGGNNPEWWWSPQSGEEMTRAIISPQQLAMMQDFVVRIAMTSVRFAFRAAVKTRDDGDKVERPFNEAEKAELDLMFADEFPR